MRRALFILLLSACLPSAALADLDALKAAAARGDAQKALELGELYEYGFGLKHNLVPALAWYSMAAERGNAKAVGRRDALLRELKPEQIEEAKRLERSLLASAPTPAPPADAARPLPAASPQPPAP